MDKRVEEIRRLSRKGPLDITNPSVRVAVDEPASLPATAEDRVNCPVCDEEISARAKKCRHCGEVLDPAMRTQLRRVAPRTGSKNKIAAFLLALLLGWMGAHKYYLGRVGQGVLYTLFFWTGIPAILGLIEGIVYMTMEDEQFTDKYG